MSDPEGTDDGGTIEDFPSPPLTAYDPSEGTDGGGTIEDFPSPSLTPYDPSEDREKIRGLIALILVCALVGVLAFALFSSWFVMEAGNRSNIMNVLEVVLAPLVALVGAVTGFYYGEKSK